MSVLIIPKKIDEKTAILNELGDISGIEILNNQVLVAIYMYPEVTKGGIYRPDVNKQEDKYQSKIGLMIKKGNSAFDQAGGWFKDVKIDLHDWLVFKPSEGWAITVVNDKGQKVLCRILNDVDVKGRVSRPDQVW
jgi:co-chaperonin GroES (HSP10)